MDSSIVKSSELVKASLPPRARLQANVDRSGGGMNATTLSVRDVAVRWGCADRRVRGLIAEGQLQSFRLGGASLFRPAQPIVPV